METSKVKIGFTIITTIVFVMIIISSCRKSEKNNEHDEQLDHRQKDQPHHGKESEHLMQMNQTRQWLKQELGEKYDQPVPSASEEQLTKGKEIFITYCASCHGESGKGDGQAAAALEPPPADFTDPEHASFYSEQGHIYVIRKGIKGTAMIGWENTLKEEEIFAVYGYVNSLKIQTETNEQHESGH